VQDDHFVRLLHGLRDGLAVERRDGAQVEDFEIDIFFGENVGGFERGMYHRCISNDAEVSASADDVRFTDGDDVVFRRDFAFNSAVEIFVLEENAGIRPLAS
jgi:hypothetical protein